MIEAGSRIALFLIFSGLLLYYLYSKGKKESRPQRMLREFEEERIRKKQKETEMCLEKFRKRISLKRARAFEEVLVFRKSQGALLPDKGSKDAVGYDFYTDLSSLEKEKVVIEPHTTEKMPTGIIMELPKGVMLSLESRSSLFLQGILVQGIIDPDYRGEISLMVHNLGSKPFEIAHHQKIAQGIFARVHNEENMIMEVDSVEELSKSERGEKGFGSSGK